MELEVIESDKNDCDDYCTPPEIIAAAEEAKANILPKKSIKKYEIAYKNFMNWRSENKLENFSENVLLAYMKFLSDTKKPSTLWSIYSMLRSTLNVKNNIKINGYANLTAFLKRNSKGFKAKKSNVFTKEQVRKFLLEAPNKKYLSTKIAMILGVYGACRLEELTNIVQNDLEKQGELFMVQIPITKTGDSRSFAIGKEYTNLIEKYQSIRPLHAATDRFFLCYKNGKCTTQHIGRNSFAKMPQNIAEYLDLPNVESYTGHCFRRTSATILANSGATMSDLKRHGAWKSPAVVEGYIADSVGQKTKTMQKIASEIALPSCSHSNLQFQESDVIMSDLNIGNGAKKSQNQKEEARNSVELKKKATEKTKSKNDLPCDLDYNFSFPEFEEIEINNNVDKTIGVNNSLNNVSNLSEENSVNKLLSGQDIHFHLSGCSNFNIHIHTHKA